MDNILLKLKEVKQIGGRLSQALEKACLDKKSTNELTPERLVWEISNKLFSLIVSNDNAINTKDSLIIHLLSRYAYELLIVSIYIFSDKDEIEERSKKFLSFKSFDDTNQRDWKHPMTFSQLVEESPYDFKETHKRVYKALSNFAHPTIDSFLLNRRGAEAEQKTNCNTSLLILGTITEIIKILLPATQFFNENEQKALLTEISLIETELRVLREV